MEIHQSHVRVTTNKVYRMYNPIDFTVMSFSRKLRQVSKSHWSSAWSKAAMYNSSTTVANSWTNNEETKSRAETIASWAGIVWHVSE